MTTKDMTDLQNKLIELSRSEATFRCTPFEDGWSIMVRSKVTGKIMDCIEYNEDQSQIKY
jgi:hypothetical protein